MSVLWDMIMHEAADSGLGIVSSRTGLTRVGLAPLRTYSQQRSTSQWRGSPGRVAEGGKNTHRHNGTQTKGGSLESGVCRVWRDSQSGAQGGSLKCHFKLIDAASAAGECEANTDLC